MTDKLKPTVDETVANPARRYNYWLGGKDNFAADRASGDDIAAAFPHIRTAAVENRAFLRRTVQYLVDRGVRQFLDIGTGLPTADNTHEIAQGLAPDSRIVYVDNDPMVMAHARSLLTSTPQGATTYIEADLRHPEQILTHPGMAGLDLNRPVALLLLAVLHFLPIQEQAESVVDRLLRALAPGSYLVISHATGDLWSPEDLATITYATKSEPFALRRHDQVEALFCGAELVEPGLVVVSDWRRDLTPPPPDDTPGQRPPHVDPAPDPAQVAVIGGVAHLSARHVPGEAP